MKKLSFHGHDLPDAAISPSEQNTDAKPKANESVGRSIFLSSLSPAAVDM
jgi:hypothetical protein